MSTSAILLGLLVASLIAFVIGVSRANALAKRGDAQLHSRPGYYGTYLALWTLLLVPATLAPAYFMPDRLGPFYATIAALTGLAFGWLAMRLAISRTRPAARLVFIASIIHLPLLLVAMVGEALVRAVL